MGASLGDMRGVFWLENADNEHYVEDEANADAANEGAEVGHVSATDARAGPRAGVVKLLDHNPAVAVVHAAGRPVRLRLVAPSPPFHPQAPSTEGEETERGGPIVRREPGQTT